MVPCVPYVSDAHAPGCLDHVDEKVIHHARPSFSIAPWAGSDAHVSIVNVFDGGQGVKMGILTGLPRCSHIVFWHLYITISIN